MDTVLYPYIRHSRFRTGSAQTKGDKRRLQSAARPPPNCAHPPHCVVSQAEGPEHDRSHARTLNPSTAT